jgi:DNA polymerase-3 subunit delta
MKIAAARVDKFLAGFPPAIRLLLMYGPDAGLVRERAERVVQRIAGSVADPFRVAEIRGDALRTDPTRLHDEAAALSLIGGRRVVRLRDATDAAVDAVSNVLESVTGDTLVVVESGDLPARSRLRKLCEDSDRAAALPSYPDDPGSLADFVRRTLSDRAVEASPDAVEYLVAVLGADRLASRSELDKLALYAGPGAEVTLDDAIACVGDSGESTLEDVAFAVAGGDGRALSRALSRAYAEGASPIAVLRAAIRHFDRLHATAGHIASGGSAEQAMAALRPPVFFKRQAAFGAQVRAWRLRDLTTALAALNQAESTCKSTGVPAEAVCAQALMTLMRARDGRA